MLKRTLIYLWLILTLSLAGWWFYFTINQVDERYRQMLIGEGLFWMILLAIGAISLILMVRREERQQKQIKQFFAAFSHDVKTAIGSLRLQAESLREDGNADQQPLLDRLIAETVRLQLQLENSLILARTDEQKLFLEPVSLKQLVSSLEFHWPNMRFILPHDVKLVGDETALLNVLNNITQNAFVHGGATEILIRAIPQGVRVRVEVENNGRGFEGSLERIGTMFYRPTPKSGTGVGLFIVKDLIEKMHGRFEVFSSPKFTVAFELQGKPV